jgi:alpha-mannosidase
LGKHQFELSLSIINNKEDFLNSGIHLIGKEFNAPLMTIIPTTIHTIIRANDKLILSPLGLIQLAMNPHMREFEPYLPENLSFLEITNRNIMLSSLKKAEQEDYLIVRLYNLASNSQSTEIKFVKDLSIKNANIVNLLEETPVNKIKAEIISIKGNIFMLKLDAHVIATIKLKIEPKISQIM